MHGCCYATLGLIMCELWPACGTLCDVQAMHEPGRNWLLLIL